MHHFTYVPDKATVYLLLGAMPFAVAVLPRRLQPSIEWRGVPFFGGVVSTFLQFVAEVAGLLLDVFFQTMISRLQLAPVLLSLPRRSRRVSGRA